MRVALLSLLICSLPVTLYAQGRLAELAGNGAVILQSPTGEMLVDINSSLNLIPASIVKVPLAHVALVNLGEDFRFETHFFVNDDRDLLLRGFGDPFLVSEEIERITKAISRAGLKEVRRLVVDDSAFEQDLDLPLERGADDPYAARNSALAANFNTVNLKRNSEGQLVSAEPQTPLTEVAKRFGAGLLSGEERRVNLGDNPEMGLRQVHELFAHFLLKSGVTLTDQGFYRSAGNEDWKIFYEHQSSRSLKENLDGMLRYSNNFIANQLFLMLGAKHSGYPATTESARLALEQQLAALYGENYGTDPELLLMTEGSGLGRNQRTSAAGMIAILNSFRPYAELLPEYDGVLRKSGTLTGVYNFIGYIRGSDGLYPFVILSNQAANNRAQILRLLKQQI